MTRCIIILCCLSLMIASASHSRAQSPDPFHFFPFENLTTETIQASNAAGAHSWDATIKTDGDYSLHYVSNPTTGWGYQIYYDLKSGSDLLPQDTSAYNYIGMDVYGDGSGAQVYMQFSDTVANTVYAFPAITWTGWKHLVFEKANLTQEYGTPEALWPNVIRLQLLANHAAVPSGTPVDIYIDNITATNDPGLPPPDDAMKKTAALRTITVDGDVSDWDMSASDPTHIDVSARSSGTHTYNLQADIRYAWDQDYLYMLIQEGGASVQSQEAGDAGAYFDAPYVYDGITFVIDLKNANNGRYSIEPWMGFNSGGLAGLWTGRKNNDDTVFTTDFLASGSVRTSGTFAQHNRVIEAAIKWSDLVSQVDQAHQPLGGLAAAVVPGFTFGSDPCLLENDYNGQSFINGSQYVLPQGNEPTAVDVVLGSAPNNARFWSAFE